MKFPWGAGNDVDDATHRLISEQGPGTTLNDLDTFHILECDGRDIWKTAIRSAVQTASIHHDQGIGMGV